MQSKYPQSATVCLWLASLGDAGDITYARCPQKPWKRPSPGFTHSSSRARLGSGPNPYSNFWTCDVQCPSSLTREQNSSASSCLLLPIPTKPKTRSSSPSTPTLAVSNTTPRTFTKSQYCAIKRRPSCRTRRTPLVCISAPSSTQPGSSVSSLDPGAQVLPLFPAHRKQPTPPFIIDGQPTVKSIHHDHPSRGCFLGSKWAHDLFQPGR